MKLQLTTGGKDCLLHALEPGGTPPVFTSIKYGNGEDAGLDATTLTNIQAEMEITVLNREEGSEFVTLEGTIDNTDESCGIEQSFRANEIGVFVRDTDSNDESAEILFAYAHVEDDEAVFIPASQDYTFEMTDNVMVYVGEVENVTAIIAQSMTTATKAELNQHTGDKNNPHEVTAEQVGLGNVPNVTTDGQTPTVGGLETELEEQTLLTETSLTAGDNLTTIVSKTAYAIRWLISHITNKSNPHGVTASQVGAAATSHKHSASDIASGVLSVQRGGTGASSIDQFVAQIATGVANLYQTGSYTGNGNTGSGNPITISYRKKPKFIIVQPVDGTSGTDEGFLCLADVTTLYSGGFNDDVGNGSSDLHFTWGSTSVSWYGTSSYAYRHCNKSGTLYRYLIVY